MNSNGTAQRQMTHNSVDDRNPSWSKTGKLAFNRDSGSIEQIVVMDVDSGVEHPFLPGTDSSQPSWSWDGSMLTFVSEKDGNHEIYVARADGTEVVRVLTMRRLITHLLGRLTEHDCCLHDLTLVTTTNGQLSKNQGSQLRRF